MSYQPSDMEVKYGNKKKKQIGNANKRIQIPEKDKDNEWRYIRTELTVFEWNERIEEQRKQ